MSDATQYDSNQVVAVFGSIKIDEKGVDEFVVIEPAEDDYTIVTGVGGQTVFNRSNNKGCKVTIRVLQTSPVNRLLSEARKADLASPNGTFSAFTVIDRLSGSELHSGSKAKITRPPNASFGKQAKDNEWTIFVADMDLNFGGH
jgi:hypothetical protein